MKKLNLIFWLITVVFLIGCGDIITKSTPNDLKIIGNEIICNKPYIRLGNACCLDKDGNSICDSDEVQKEIKQTTSSIPESVKIETTIKEIVKKQDVVEPEIIQSQMDVGDKDEIIKKLDKAKTLYYYSPQKQWFFYIDNENNLIKITYLPQTNQKVDIGQPYSGLIIDRNKKTVHTFCTKDKCDLTKLDVSYKIDYTLFNPETILDYVKNMKQIKLNKGKTKQIKDSGMIYATYIDSNNASGEMWLNNFYYLPHEISLLKGEDMVQDVDIDSLSFSKVEIPGRVNTIVDLTKNDITNITTTS